MTQPDFRAPLHQAQQWVGDLLDNVRPDQLDGPTPCAEFSVARLIEHLLGVQERAQRMGSTGALGDAPTTISLTTLDERTPAEDFRARSAAIGRAWATWPATDLWQRTITGPFGTLPAGPVLMLYTSEYLVHGWDLAVATDQPSEADPALVEPVLAGMRQALPAHPRGGAIPFDPPVASAADAGPTEQLANWLGRSH